MPRRWRKFSLNLCQRRRKLIRRHKLFNISALAPLLSGKALVCKTNMRGFDSRRRLIDLKCPGGGTVYAEDLKSLTRKGLWVRIPPRALNKGELFSFVSGCKTHS